MAADATAIREAERLRAVARRSREKKQETKMNEAQIKHMVERFLNWRLPSDFSPDGGISFERRVYENAPREPSGTNLLDWTQAEAMVRHMIDGLPL